MKTVDGEWLDFLAAVSNGNADFVARYVGMRLSKPFGALEEDQIAYPVSVDTLSGLSTVSQTTKNLAGLSESSGCHYTRGL